MPCASFRSRRKRAIRSIASCTRRIRSCWCLIAHPRPMFSRWSRRAQRCLRCCTKNRVSDWGDDHMQSFHIRYRNTQGTLMRILNAASRRALDLPLVKAEQGEKDHQVTLVLDVNAKQVGQLYREWYSITDVIHVGSGAAHTDTWTGAHPPAGVTIEESRAAARA